MPSLRRRQPTARLAEATAQGSPAQTAGRPVRHRGPDGPTGSARGGAHSGARKVAHSPRRLSAVVQSLAMALRAEFRLTLPLHTAFLSLFSTESLLCAGSLP